MNQSRGTFTAQISRKRRERDNLFLPSHYHVKRKEVQSHSSFPKTTSSAQNPVRSNRILAGYMAHEFLTMGTLLGHKFEPAQAIPLLSTPTSESEKKPVPQSPATYAEVASLLKTDGAHIPGIVNPNQLAQWIQK